MLITLSRASGTKDLGFAQPLPFVEMTDSTLVLDAEAVKDIHPVFAARLQLFIDWHREKGRKLEIRPPQDPESRRIFDQLRIGRSLPAGRDGVPAVPDEDVVLPLVRLSALTQVDAVVELLYTLLLDHFDDVAVVRDAVQMAISELAQNGVEHGTNPLGCILAARRRVEHGTSRLILAVADLGVGIPTHIRRRHPEFVVDEHAIAAAVQQGITGSHRPDRGHGFEWVLNETLASAATAGQMVVLSGRGRFRREIADGPPRDSGGPSPPILGTWIAHEWLTVVGR